MAKHLPAMQETWVQSQGHEDPLEKEMATHSSTFALKIPWAEELGAGYYLIFYLELLTHLIDMQQMNIKHVGAETKA